VNLLKSGIDAGLFFVNYITKKEFCSHRPLTIMIEPTNMCNLDCITCPHGTMTRKKGLMSFDLYKKIIDCNSDYIRHLDLFILGEPLIHKRIYGMIEYAAKNKIWTRIFTNATLLDERNSEKLISAGLSTITISLDGLNKERYEEIRKGGSYDAIVENIRKFVEIRNSKGKKAPHVSVKYVDLGYESSDVKFFFKKMKDIGVDSIEGMSLHSWPGVKLLTDKLLKRKGKKKKYYHCLLPWSVLSVGWNGKVYGCCDDFNGLYEIGDMNDQPYLKEMWNNQRMKNLRKKLADQKIDELPHCKDCDRPWRSPYYDTLFKNAMWSLKEMFQA